MQHPVPVERVRALLGRGLVRGANELTEEEFSEIRALMGPPVIEETALMDHVKEYVSARGYYFDDETLYNYHISLKTRPFVILAGLSGTGKSKLSQLYAEALGHTTKNRRYLRVAVRPSWNDDRYLLGYLNTITGDYVAEPALDFIIEAERDRENLYFFCLDEMNLAHVEYYFSQFLSALEEEQTADRRIPLFSRSLAASMKKQGKEIGYEQEVIVPPNLLFTGTVNVDETTQPLSDKVIDRANTIEFFDVDLEKVPRRRPTPEVTPVAASMWHGYRATTPDSSYRDRVVAINEILNEAGLGLGYRVLREIELYLANSHGLLEPQVAFDLQVKQRILPRVRGSLALRGTLKKLIAFTQEEALPRSQARLEEMEQRLVRDGYTSFWR
jgi:5-methylcytosine-specific restriction endonuclease McrBC GTP-binding regulatory subunit McrB